MIIKPIWQAGLRERIDCSRKTKGGTLYTYICMTGYNNKRAPTCFFRMMCLPFQYFIMPRACKVLTMSYESMAISLLISVWNRNYRACLMVDNGLFSAPLSLELRIIVNGKASMGHNIQSCKRNLFLATLRLIKWTNGKIHAETLIFVCVK